MTHITFIHGIANKPPLDPLCDLWCRGLADNDGLDLGSLGISCSMIYWADVMYDSPLVDAEGYESVEGEMTAESESPDLSFTETASVGEKVWVDKLALKLNVSLAVDEVVEMVQAPEEKPLERIPLPWFLKRKIMKTFLRDVHHYLFDETYSPRPGASYSVQKEIRRRALEVLQKGAAMPGPHILISHSMGTVIAYDCLKRVPECPTVDALVTIGSPLGLDEIQDKLKPEWSRDDGFPHERVRGAWVNIFDSLDPVAGFDGRFANDYRRAGREVVIDINEQNYGKWRHNISHYLGGVQLRGRLRGLLGMEE